MSFYNLALKIHCSSRMNTALVNQGFITQKRGEIEVKGKGKQVTHWLLKKHDSDLKLNQLGLPRFVATRTCIHDLDGASSPVHRQIICV